MRSLSWLQRCWRSAAVWLRRVPVRDPVDRRNAPALQLLLLYLGLEIPLNKLYILLNARLQMTTVQLAVDLGTDAAIALAAWYGIWRIRQGAVKPAIGMFITVVLCSAVIANVAFGYQLQAFDPFPLLLLTLAALVIGRRALWSVYACIALVFLLGMASPWGRNPQDGRSPFQNLPSLAMSYLMVTLVLDRSVAALRESLHRARRTAARLQVEIREREQAQQRVLHLQKIESVGQLASGVSHDFNNILGAILGYAEQRHRLHELDFDPPRDAVAMAEALEGIALAAQRGSTISGKLLSFSRRDLAVPTHFDAAQAVQAIAPMLAHLLGAHVRLQVDTCAAPVPVCLDRSQFDLVMLNFAANARDAMPDGGNFSVRVSRQHTMVRIALVDTGHGMPAEVLAQVFEPFFTTKPVGKGTGLGLAVAHELVLQAGGLLSVDSVPGAGTQFVMSLPLVPAPAA
ncbi:sensor histidine kinase [Xanthomonas arboricola]|uniref:histidine kinase n=3 Tax=Xanthomonas arboricola TaxID=56448 RepID=A0A2S7CGH1_9XANT|nr:ATP-binding protein [Xanthomonas arboricola]PPU13407.1 two-component sensor histidine kinase [Xanthomonas arboricola pv. corylina]AKU51469.1 histidine kinase [Xanthomonas arboricola pv. juglandis]KOB00389.1 histidine kinase [Xanthomonas arboricola]KOB10420.1 histidine kinase [Xanthomonas arboricola]KOB11381.1 histidine kinase [Xanthomonas arboricola]